MVPNVETVRAVKELIRGEEAVGLVRRGARREVGRGECSAAGPTCQKRLPEDFLFWIRMEFAGHAGPVSRILTCSSRSSI